VTSPTPPTRLNSSRSRSVAKFDRKRLSYVESGDVSEMTSRMLADCFLTVTPCRATSSGSSGSAAETRFCTSTCAASRSVPISKVTVSEYEPSLEDVEDM